MDKNFKPPKPREMFAPEPLMVRIRRWRPRGLQLGLIISAVFHAGVVPGAVLLWAWIYGPIDFTRVFQDTPLEVILVNARTNEAPTKAQAIAQANLAGGGEAEAGIATSPLPPSHADSSLPVSLDQVVAACLAKDPGARIASAEELAHMLYPLARRKTVAPVAPPVATLRSRATRLLRSA